MNPSINVVFMGTPDFAVPSLTALIEEKYHVAAVVTQPDRPKGRKKVITPPPVKVVAEKYGIPVFQPEKLRDPENVQKVLSYQPDLIVTAAYGQILPESLLKVPKFGSINVHASLLPKYRGGAPIHKAIMEGEKETGVTIMYMVKALDAGDMLAQRAIPITEEDHVGTMHDKLSRVGAELLTETLPSLLKGELTPVAQDETLVTYAPTIRRDDEKVDWSRSAKQLANQVRGLHPWPVAFTTWRGTPFKIWWAHVSDESADLTPGTVKSVDEKGIVVSTSEGCLILTDIQPAGKKRMSVEEFIRGHQMEAGERLGDE